MSIHTHKMENGQKVELTAEEIAELDAIDSAYVPLTEQPLPTKEQLLSQLQALQIKIESL